MTDPTVAPVPPAQLSDFGALLRRQWWLILIVVVLGALAGYGYTSAQTPLYTSTTQVLVTPTGADDQSVLANGRTRGEINLDTEAQLLTSTAVVKAAADTIGDNATPAELVSRVKVSVPPNTEVLTIAYRSTSPEAARTGANAFAVAYLANRAQEASAQITARQTARQVQIDTLNRSLQNVTKSLAGLKPDSVELSVAQAQIQSLSTQIALLSAEVDGLDVSSITPGRTITDANLPRSASSPVLTVNLAAGAMLGLLVGLGLALLRYRSDRQLRTPDEVSRRTGLPVLANVPETVGGGLAEPTTPAGRGYVRLRNLLTSRTASDARVLMVAGVDSDSSEVAANLAASLSKTGAEVTLVCASPESGTVQRLRLRHGSAGLSEVLSGSSELADALQVPLGFEQLRVLAPGSEPERAGALLQTQAARELLRTLRRSARYVVLEAPPTNDSSQAQTLSALADAALIVIVARHSASDRVLDAIEQFAVMNTPVVGSVLIPAARHARKMRTGGAANAAAGSGTVQAQTADPAEDEVPADGRAATRGTEDSVDAGADDHRDDRTRKGAGGRRPGPAAQRSVRSASRSAG
ncbi:MAG: Wzz/FepE/Etk N-terminal domain-containing protein [Geodermatophilaceae bacterium]